MATTKSSAVLTLKDRLSHLSHAQACRLLGPQGKRLLREGAGFEIENLEQWVELEDELFRLRLPYYGGVTAVTISPADDARDRIQLECSDCDQPCEHIGAALSLILEEKLALGLAAPPPERQPIEALGEEELIDQALDDRTSRAADEKFRLVSTDPDHPWTDYTIHSAASGKSYRLALRGEGRGESFCSCPDFRTNTLGTCKHILYAVGRVQAKFPVAARKKPFRTKEAFVHLQYGEELTLHLRLPERPNADLAAIAGRLAAGPIDDVAKLMKCLGQLQSAGHEVLVYPDAEKYIERRLEQARLQRLSHEMRKDPTNHPLRRTLLKTELLPYQLDGVAFALGAGRAILADDMGLGKTIQGIGYAELLAREAQIERVLVICPTSLKSQWKSEIERFSSRDAQLVLGGATERPQQYTSDCFFTICNYEQVLRDVSAIEAVEWDLIILDEGQRIKNWETKTARTIKRLESRFALILSGTPLENRLDELYSVAQFIDDRRLGPAFRFYNRHRVVDEKGKVLGYRNLDELRERLRPIVLRRTRAEVLDDLPPRNTEIVRIAPCDEQLDIHASHMRIVSMITRKPYLSEMDLLRLQKALLMCRMAANSTYLVDKLPPGQSTKLARLEELVEQLFAESGRKAVLFSEWTTMLDLIEPMLAARKLDYVRLDGSVQQKKRQALVQQFQKNDDCKLFLATNAGSTGLNLQAANTIINVDLPWNPAVLEQRIARAHRMGQRRPVDVFVLVTEATIEESLLATLSAKQDLSLAVLDAGSDVTEVDMISGVEDLRRRLEILLGAKPEAPVDQSQREQVTAESLRWTPERERVAAAGGEMLGAVFNFLGELTAQQGAAPPDEQLVSRVRDRLGDCVEAGADGSQRLTLTLPNGDALDGLAQTMARLLAIGGQAN